MDIRESLNLVRRGWRTIALSVLPVVVVAIVASLAQPATYVSTSDVFISSAQGAGRDYDPSDNAYNGGLAATQRVSSYAVLATQQSVTRRVIRDVGLDLTPDELANKISATVEPGTAFIRIGVTDEDPVTAQKICRALVSELGSAIASIERPPGSATPLLKATVTDAADLPASRDGPALPQVVLVALVLGIFLGLLVLFWREFLARSPRSATAVERASGAPVLASTSFAARGKSQAVRADELRSLRRALSQHVPQASSSFVVTSPDADEAKSLTAVELARSIASTGQRVLLVDADLRRPALGSLLGLDAGDGLTSALGHGSALVDVTRTQGDHLDVVTSGPLSSQALELLDAHTYLSFMSEARATYDVVVVDAPEVGDTADAAVIARATDGVVLVVPRSTKRKRLIDVREQLADFTVTLIGVVIVDGSPAPVGKD